MKENVIYSKVVTCKHFAADELKKSAAQSVNTIWHGIADLPENQIN